MEYKNHKKSDNEKNSLQSAAARNKNDPTGRGITFSQKAGI